MTSSPREFDIVLYGATGFAGKLTAQYLAEAGKGARIALAGRSLVKVRDVRDTLGAEAQDWPLIEADAAQPSTLADMAARTQVVVTTVGPYTKYGLPLVAGVCGGRHRLRRPDRRDAVHPGQRRTVPQAGRRHRCAHRALLRIRFRPFGYHRLRTARPGSQDGAGELAETSLVLRSFAGGVSGGTVASMIEFMRTAAENPQSRGDLADPYTLTTDRGAEPELGHQSDNPWRRGA